MLNFYHRCPSISLDLVGNEDQASVSWILTFDYAAENQDLFIERFAKFFPLVKLQAEELHHLLNHPAYCDRFYASYGPHLFRLKHFDAYMSLAIDYALSGSQTAQTTLRRWLKNYLESWGSEELRLLHMNKIYAQSKMLWSDRSFVFNLPLSLFPSMKVLAEHLPAEEWPHYYAHKFVVSKIRPSIYDLLESWLCQDHSADNIKKFQWLLEQETIDPDFLAHCFVFSLTWRKFDFALSILKMNVRSTEKHLGSLIRMTIEEERHELLKDILNLATTLSMPWRINLRAHYLHWTDMYNVAEPERLISSCPKLYTEVERRYLNQKRLEDEREFNASLSVTHIAIRPQFSGQLKYLKLPDQAFRYQSLLNLTQILLSLAMHAKTQIDAAPTHTSLFHIVRLVTPEFFFYVERQPLTLNEWHFFLTGLERIARGFPQHIHAVLSSFAVAIDARQLMNLVIYLECGQQPNIHVFCKANPHEHDLNYKEQRIYCSAFADDQTSDDPVDFIATDASVRPPLTINFQSVFPMMENRCMMAIDVCADVFMHKSKKFFMRQYAQDNHQLLPMQADYLITETKLCTRKPNSLGSILAEASIAKQFLRMMYAHPVRIYEVTSENVQIKNSIANSSPSINWDIEVSIEDLGDFDNAFKKTSRTISIRATSSPDLQSPPIVEDEQGQNLSLGEFGRVKIFSLAPVQIGVVNFMAASKRECPHPSSFVQSPRAHRQNAFFHRLKEAQVGREVFAPVNQHGPTVV